MDRPRPEPDQARRSSEALERVAALAMAMPRRHRGPLRYPPFASLRRDLR